MQKNATIVSIIHKVVLNVHKDTMHLLQGAKLTFGWEPAFRSNIWMHIFCLIFPFSYLKEATKAKIWWK